MENYYEYLGTFSTELGSRIVEMYPPLQGPKDPIAPALKTLLRKPLPAQAMTITGLAKYLNIANSARIVGECGTGKTLMSVGTAHAHANGRPYTAIAMCPPHLVLKWAREVLVTVARARAFIVYDLRNGGDPARPHGIIEVQLRNGHAVHKGMKTTLSELRRIRRKDWKRVCPVPAYFIVSKETGKLGYFWKHAYTEAKSGRWRSTVTNPDTGQSIPGPDGGYLRRADFGDAKVSSTSFTGWSRERWWQKDSRRATKAAAIFSRSMAYSNPSRRSPTQITPALEQHGVRFDWDGNQEHLRYSSASSSWARRPSSRSKTLRTISPATRRVWLKSRWTPISERPMPRSRRTSPKRSRAIAATGA